jgi:hypothetical protein
LSTYESNNISVKRKIIIAVIAKGADILIVNNINASITIIKELELNFGCTIFALMLLVATFMSIPP